jgi:hypothetical protein
MATEEENSRRKDLPRVSSGPLRVTEEAGKLFVVGFGLRLPVKDQEEGLKLIAELEDQGYRICF